MLGSKLVVLGMAIPPLIGNPCNGYINPYYWVDDHPLLYGNNGSLDPSTYRKSIRIGVVSFALDAWCMMVYERGQDGRDEAVLVLKTPPQNKLGNKSPKNNSLEDVLSLTNHNVVIPFFSFFASTGHPSHLLRPDSACHGPGVDLRMFCSEVRRVRMKPSQSNCAVLQLEGWQKMVPIYWWGIELDANGILTWIHHE